ncbi:MAG: peptidase [Myxococcaceae bacterium]|nr:peptidase [Myxococcaceae bacterium]
MNSNDVIDINALHRTACIADAHSDALMWNRDLTVQSAEGHVDFPRLREAGVKIQCFTVVTRGVPLLDGFGLFIRKRNWPPHARRGEWARCVWQLDRMAEFCRRSAGQASIAGSGAQLEANLQKGALSAVVGIEGGHAIEGKVERVAELHARGVRFIGLTHLANNELGGSSFPLMGNRPLSPLGVEVLDAMAQIGMAVDVAHASSRTLAQLLGHPKARPFCSHGGVVGATRSWRNLPDEALKAIADKGGVVGIIFASVFLGGDTFDDVARHLEHAVNVMGEEGVGLGSDFDGLISLPKGMRDVRDLPKLTEALVKRGHPLARIEKVLGGNFRRFFREVL